MLSMDPQERELDALIGLYLLRCEAEGKSPETQRAYRESLQRFCRFVHLVNGPRDVHELTPRLIYHFLASFAHLSLETRHRYFREVRCFFNWLIETDRLTTNPFRGIRNVRLPQRIVAPFTRAEIGVLLAACPPTPVGRRDRAIILVLLDTGIRCSELAQQRLGDFDATTQRIRVRHGKANKQRVVAFAERCAAAVELYFEERGRLPGPLFVAASGGSGRLTASATGLRPNGIKQMLRRLGRRAGGPASTRSMRIAFGTPSQPGRSNTTPASSTCSTCSVMPRLTWCAATAPPIAARRRRTDMRSSPPQTRCCKGEPTAA